uniref:G protein-regulated inducer of neurite outgrowth C-terminal domain-containing protein n=1 Tax=Terrapene triunguis TaxID=2587831 RepID=A0A674IE39_9SAUR
MAANSHQVQTHSHQETLNSVCHRPLNLNSHPLSKSSSSLACIGQVSSDERQSNKQDLKKSLSSTVCQTQVSKNDVGSTPSSEWSSTQSGMVESSSAVRTTSDQSPGDNVQNRATTTNRFLTVDQTPISLEGKDTKMHVKSSTVENISSVCDTHQQRPHMPGSGFPNRTMCSQSIGLSQGGMTYNNVSSSIYSPTVMTIHNSTALPCNARQDSAMKIDGTVSAYCHSLPIPSLQLVPRLVCSVSESGREQVTPGYCQSLPTSDMMTFPKLVSSVSESGLDHLSHQCADMIMKTKDTWTMTSMNDLTKELKSPLECKDAEVQTISTIECKSVATSPSVVAEGHSHVFPEVNLEHDQEAPKSPVREVRWDDEGMTWEVYGAAVDPEVLGLAIQKHLEIQIEQFQTEPIELSRKSTEESPPAKEAKKRPFRTMMHSLRHPSCCARSNTVVE